MSLAVSFPNFPLCNVDRCCCDERQGNRFLFQDVGQGGTSKLDDMQLEALALQVEKTLFLTSKAICHWVKSEWGVEYTESGMTGLLHAKGFSYKKPTVTPGKALSEEVQRDFTAKIVETIENKGPHDQVYFADGVHPRLNPIAGYGWIRTGERKEIPSHTGREHLNIARGKCSVPCGRMPPAPANCSTLK